MKRKISILDCTLRDGGFALEDAEKNNTKTKVFNKTLCDRIGNFICESNAEIIEIGAIEQSTNSKTQYAIYQNIEEISKVIPTNLKSNQMAAAFYRGPDINSKDIPSWNPNYCEALRVCVRYSEISKSLKFCSDLSKKGYKVFIQPMVTMRYSLDELKELIYMANEMNAYALYFVDSYGYMNGKEVEYYYHLFHENLRSDIHIGFHAHNNMELAFSNTINFIEKSDDRNIIIDSCASGMGQGTGNLQSEIIMNYLNEYYDKTYSLNEILDVCEIVEKYNTNGLWGYSSTRFVSAANRTAYKYALSLKNQYNMNLKEINNLLSEIPEDLRFRFSEDNIKELLKRNERKS